MLAYYFISIGMVFLMGRVTVRVKTTLSTWSVTEHQQSSKWTIGYSH